MNTDPVQTSEPFPSPAGETTARPEIPQVRPTNLGVNARPGRRKEYRLFKRDDVGHEMPPDAPGYRDRHYYFRITYRGKSYLRCLETNDKVLAASRARTKAAEIKSAVQAEDYTRLSQTKIRQTAVATLGDIKTVYRQRARVDTVTKRNNLTSLNGLIRYSLRQPDLAESAIDRLSSHTLTRKLVLDFQDHLMAAAGTDCIAQDRAATNANSLLRQARSLFSSSPRNDMLSHYKDAGLVLPDLTAFRKTPLLAEPDHSFEVPPAELLAKIEAAAPALKQTDPNAYRIYLLSKGCGLRKKEIAHLCRSHILHVPAVDVLSGAAPAGPRHFVVLRTRAAFRTKNRKPRTIPMEDYVWRELESLNPTVALPAAGPVDPAAPPPEPTDYILTGELGERYQTAFKRFGAWLKKLGWNRSKKAHELRKLYSSVAGAQVGSDVAHKLVGNSLEVFHAHYFNLLSIPDVKIFGKV